MTYRRLTSYLAGLALMAGAVSLSGNSATQTGAPPHSRAVVVIDAGHGGKDPGTRSRSGILEKNVTLTLAKKVAESLRGQGVTVIMTRTRDTYVGVENRIASANRAAPALLVSIHCDANPNPSFSGYSLIVASAASRGSTASSADISQRLDRAGIERHVVRSDNRGLAVLKQTSSPAVLVEAGFLSNRRNAVLLKDSQYQTTISEAIAGGIVDFLHQ